MEKNGYKIDDIFFHCGGYTSNEEFFKVYENYSFQATNDKEAIEIVEEIQRNVEKEIIESGNELEDNDPVLAAHIFKLADEDVWIEVEL